MKLSNLKLTSIVIGNEELQYDELTRSENNFR